MEKILPVKYPPLTTYTGYADALAILFSYEEAYDWIFSHYIQIFAVDIINRNTPENDSIFHAVPCFFGDFDTRRIANTLFDGIFLRREMSPYLNVFEIPNVFVTSFDKSYISFIKRCIDYHMYVYAYADVSKIKEYNLNVEMSHQLFIYGYDDAKNTFYFADFLGEDGVMYGKFTFSECSFEELENAFINIGNIEFPPVKSVAAIQYASYGPFVFDYSYIQDTIYEYINPDKVKAGKFNDYAMSYHSLLKWKTKTYTGVDVYTYLSKFIDFELKMGKEYIDPRLYHAMYDHKEMMIRRIEYFISKGYLSHEKLVYLEEYKKVKNNTFTIRTLILKFNIQKDRSFLERAQALLEDTREVEIEILKKVFNI